ncbi:MAG: hypothetical protein V1724_10135, partial [Chloroflexota bacterium]
MTSARLFLLLLPVSVMLLACGIAPTPTQTSTPTPTSLPEFKLIVQYKEAFPMSIDTDKQYVATLRTERGDIV